MIATPHDLTALAELLADAFVSDPFVRWMLGPRADDRSRVVRLYRAVLAQNLPHGHVVVHEARDAVAVFRPPSRSAMGTRERLTMLVTVVRALGPCRFLELAAHLHAIERRHPTGPVAQLVVLGVDPAKQGRGRASALLRPTLQRWDRARITGWLETSNARALPLYERFGFEVRSTMSLPNGPHVWFMTRPPACER